MRLLWLLHCLLHPVGANVNDVPPKRPQRISVRSAVIPENSGLLVNSVSTGISNNGPKIRGNVNNLSTVSGLVAVRLQPPPLSRQLPLYPPMKVSEWIFRHPLHV